MNWRFQVTWTLSPNVKGRLRFMTECGPEHPSMTIEWLANFGIVIFKGLRLIEAAQRSSASEEEEEKLKIMRDEWELWVEGHLDNMVSDLFGS
jgi:hypothetical protein